VSIFTGGRSYVPDGVCSSPPLCTVSTGARRADDLRGCFTVQDDGMYQGHTLRLDLRLEG
jgi:hypothetical protein